jgi:ankyrin repeat protein
MARKSSKKNKEAPSAEMTVHRTPQLAALLQAAGSGSFVAVQRYLTGGGHPDASTTFSAAGFKITAPLLIAAILQHHGRCAGSMQLLLDAGAEVGVECVVPTGETRTALMMASCLDCCTTPTQLLLQRGADSCYQVKSEGCTALHLAAQNGCAEQCTALLDSTGGERALHLKDYYGWTPIYSAASRGHAGVVKLLHERGAKTTFVDKDGDSLEHMAVQYAPVLQYVLTHCSENLNTVNKQGCTPLMTAVIVGATECARQLLDARAGISIRGPYSETAATIAAKQGHTAVLELLLAHDSQATLAATCNGLPLLTVAVLSGQIATARLLLERGADVHAVNALTQTAPLQNTALYWCTSNRGGAELTQLLLQHGAAVNSTNRDGDTPLVRAAISGDIGSARALVSAGADVCAVCTNGMTCLHAAAKRGHLELLQLLLEHGAAAVIDNLAVACNCCGPRTAVMMCEQPAHLKLLLAAGADVHKTTD